MYTSIDLVILDYNIITYTRFINEENLFLIISQSY